MSSAMTAKNVQTSWTWVTRDSWLIFWRYKMYRISRGFAIWGTGPTSSDTTLSTSTAAGFYH